jgi:hypothetical protein
MLSDRYFLHYGLISGANTAAAWMGFVAFRSMTSTRGYPTRFGVGEIKMLGGEHPLRQKGRHRRSNSETINYRVLVVLVHSILQNFYTKVEFMCYKVACFFP